MFVPTSGEKRDPSDPQQVLRSAAVIFLLLLVGLTGFAGIVVFLVSRQELDPAAAEEMPSFLPLLAGVVTAVTVLPAVTLGGILVRASAGARGLTPHERAHRYMGIKILLAALVEGPGLLWGIIALLSGNLIHLLGLAFCVLAMVLMFPREEEWSNVMGSDRTRRDDGPVRGDRSSTSG